MHTPASQVGMYPVQFVPRTCVVSESMHQPAAAMTASSTSGLVVVTSKVMMQGVVPGQDTSYPGCVVQHSTSRAIWWHGPAATVELEKIAEIPSVAATAVVVAWRTEFIPELLIMKEPA